MLLATILFSVKAQAANRIEFTGVTLERRQNIELYLSAISPAQINKSARFKNRVAREIKQALRGLGYYQVLIEFEDKSDGKDYVLLAKITAGKYVFIEVADLQLNGEAVRDAEFLALQKAKAPRKGERMHHGIYEDYKKALLSLSHRKGYFDAEFSRAELEVTPGDRRGKMHLHFQSGPRYRFGEIKFVGGQIRDARLQTLLPFKSGDFYSAERLAKLSQNLANTLWFGSVDLIADPDNRKDGALPLTIELQPAVKNTVETGIGYATDVGARIKTSWFKPWVNDRGHSLNADLALSQREQYLETSYRFPLRDVANDYYQLSFGYKNKDLLDTDSTSYNLKGERHWLLSNQWQRTLSLRWLYEDYVQGAQRDTSNLVLPGFAFSRNRDSGGSMPLDADNYLLSVEAANTSWGSDTDFVRLYGRAGWIGSFSEDQRWLVRLDAGAILQEQIANIPPSLRFFAGGDSSLRGYGYQTIAPVNAEQELIGGIRLATVNLEYQHRVKGDWWLALFTDYGSAWNDQPDWKQSVGIGARWASPVGPIRLDLAYGMDHEPNGRFRIHFTLGPEL